ncbi:MAG: hypothetical protein GX021_04975 [Tissierellia bacterium]|nr:hypothetical protein [Tissierellia bacterium]
MKRNTLVIGLLEDCVEKNTFELLKKMFIALGYNINPITQYNNFFILDKDYNNILLINITSNILNSILDLGLEFDIIIHTSLNNGIYEKDKLKELVSRSQYIIINSDEDEWIHLLNDNITTIVITYGFNNKASINLSSIDKQDIIEINICVQREIQTINGTIVEPFELPIKIDTKEKVNIYSILSIIACGLVMDKDLGNINISLIYN